MEGTEINVDHPRYKKCSPAEADACAWVFADKTHLQKYYYKLPQLADFEVEGRVLYSGICHSDLHTGKSEWSDVRYPIACGHEIVAEATKIGKDVKDFKVGDKFMVGCFRRHCGNCDSCKQTDNNLCTGMNADRFTYGDNYWGGYSTHVQVHHDWCFKVPEKIKLENAAPLMCAGVTTFAPLNRFGKKGMKVAVMGVGGLGHMAVQYAHKMEMEVTGFVHNLASQEEVKKLGADKVVDWTKTDLTKEFSGYFDIILNTVPVNLTREQLQTLLNLVKPRGHFIQISLPERSQAYSFNPAPLVMKAINFTGSLVGSYKETMEMLNFSADHGVEVKCEHFDFEDWPKAIKRIEKGKPHFRCVVDVHKFKLH